jgi:Beta-eliminating lyase
MAMANAEVGDEQRGEDPTVRLLEEPVAELLKLPVGVPAAKGPLVLLTDPSVVERESSLVLSGEGR